VNPQTTRILIVEDNEFGAKLLEIYLSDFGYIVQRVSNAEKALDLLKNDSYSIIISDVFLPGMNGGEFIRIIKQQSQTKEIPFIAMSSNNSEENILSLLNAGSDDFLIKPFSEKVLLTKVQNLLEKSNKAQNKYTKQLEHHFSLSKPVLLVCVDNVTPEILQLLQLFKKEYVIVESEDQLQIKLNDYNDYCILVCENASWFSVFVNTKGNLFIDLYPVLYFHDNKIPDFASQIKCFLPISKSNDLTVLIKQLDFAMNMLEAQKAQTRTVIKQAISKSSLVFEKETNYSTSEFRLSVFHENYNDMPGGDFYEIFTFNDRFSLIFLGDIMGKSWGAWYYLPAYIAYIRSTIKFLANRNIKELVKSPDKVMNLLNSYYAKDLQLSEVFTTLTLAVLDNKKKRVLISSAGGINPVLINTETQKATPIKISGMLMGIASNSSYVTVEHEIQENELLLLYTDGYTDSKQINSPDLVTNSGMIDFCSKIKNSDYKAVEIDELFLKEFSTVKFDDDRTLITISSL